MSSQYLNVTDTPHKTASSGPFTRKKTLMKDLSADVRRDIKDTLFTADTELFLDKIFPSGLPVDQIFKKLSDAGEYADGYWKEYPYPKITPQNEPLLYKPFARISNAI
ncbi:hypothetical protein C0995_003057, partial [Termitomyces sp. Mi166